MTEASSALPPLSRQVEPGTRRMMILAGVINLIIAAFVLLMAVMAAAMLDSGKGGAGLEILIPLLVFTGVPLLARYLYTGTSVDIRWIGALLWLPIVGAIAGIMLIINYA